MVEMNFDGEYSTIPQRMRDALERYCVHGIKPGSFLTALITNDLKGAIYGADPENLPLIKTYLMWFSNNTSGLWGKENFERHLSSKLAPVDPE